tara:strand:+ start:4 stop:285 length:282 start_codon:yes stop_codon:yes gene_type:complete
MKFVKPKMNKCPEYIYIYLRFLSGVYNNITITKGIIMKTIKLTKNQLKILRHCLGEYDQFLCKIDDDQIKEHKEKYGRNLSDNIKKISEKIYT